MNELYHHGVKGQKWGIRRYQNSDGSLTPEGIKRYGTVEKLRKTKEYREAKKQEYKAAREKIFKKQDEYRTELDDALSQFKKDKINKKISAIDYDKRKNAAIKLHNMGQAYLNRKIDNLKTTYIGDIHGKESALYKLRTKNITNNPWFEYGDYGAIYSYKLSKELQDYFERRFS